MAKKRRIDLPEKREQKGPLWGRHSDEDKKTSVLPKVCPLSGMELGKVVQNEILYYMEDNETKRIRTAEGVHSDVEIFDSLGIDSLNKPGKGLMRAVERIRKHLHYEPQVLLTREEAASAYRILVAVIGALGPPPSRPPKSQERDAAFFQGEKQRAEKACLDFCSVFNPDCQTGHFFNLRLNRAAILYTEGLHCPEAMHGFVWNRDLSVKVMFHSDPQLVYPPFPSETLFPGPEAPGKFQYRENGDPKRVIGVRLVWGQSRLVLFLNWRREGGKPVGPLLKEVRDAVDAPYQHQSLKERAAALEMAVRPLDLAVRYFLGWLIEAGIDISEMHDEELEIRPFDIISRVGNAVKSREKRVQTLKDLIEPLVGLPEKNCNIHWTNETKDGDYEPGQRLIFEEGSYEKHGVKTETPRPPLKLKQGEVPEAVCQVAGAWRGPLLIKDLNREIPLFGTTWMKIHCRESDFPYTSEIAAPIIDAESDRVLGVVSVECKQELSEMHLRRIELVTHLYQKLHTFYHMEQSIRTPNWEAAKRLIDEDLIDSKKQFETFPLLCKHFCEWVRDQLRLDLIQLSVYDARVSVFRPLGVTVSPDMIRALLKDKKDCARLGLDVEVQKALQTLYEGHGGGSSPAQPGTRGAQDLSGMPAERSERSPHPVRASRCLVVVAATAGQYLEGVYRSGTRLYSKHTQIEEKGQHQDKEVLRDGPRTPIPPRQQCTGRWRALDFLAKTAPETSGA